MHFYDRQIYETARDHFESFMSTNMYCVYITHAFIEYKNK